MDARGGYGTTVVILHWLIAIAIGVLIGTGWYMVDLEKGTPPVARFYNFHKSIGLIVLVLVALLISARLRDRPGPLPGTVPAWEVRAAEWSHRIFYVLLVLVPLSGYIESNFAKWGIRFFGLHLPSWLPENPTLYAVFNRIHVYSANLFAALIGLHIVAALAHALRRDGVMSRILPRRSRVRGAGGDSGIG
ncbi:cytochrome b [Coralloluteibacterium thermophilus]|uniref:Cytochrome b n=1 Tax=Coralloluteibacterium thermophilum TaxID=2707049 RepID=A0ABV9NGC3_9GAMM